MSSQSSSHDSDKENTPQSRLVNDLRVKKRVLFSPLPGEPITHFVLQSLTLQVLHQPSADSKPSNLKLPRKSVLKTPSFSPASSPISESSDPAASGLLVMLESAIQSLSGKDRASKFDTYSTLLGVFRAFENVPDRAQLFPRLSELFELILADVKRMSEEDSTVPDYPLNTKALKVTGFLLFDSAISDAIPTRQAKSLIEHSLARMEGDHPTKATTSQFLWLWQTQRLPKTVITNEIAERIIVAAMKAVFPSVIINSEQMGVILRLLDQSRECMVKNAELWLPVVINNMLDENKAIRTGALRASLEAGKLLCRTPSIGRCVQKHLKSLVHGRPYLDVTSERFASIMQEPEGGIYVAHAWGAVCTLSSSQNPETSKTLMDWMHVLYIVFNSPSTEYKVMAQSAWVRMIHYFANNGDIIYRPKNLIYLTKPISKIIARESKVFDTVRMAAVNTFCSLLYCTSKPGITHEQTSTLWTEVAGPILTTMLEPHQKDALRQRAVNILVALLEVKPLEPWTLERLLDARVSSETEILYLDPRWVRNNVSGMRDLLVLAMRSPATKTSKLRLWQALLRCLKIASAKEVHIAAESMEATATLCSIFRDLWRAPVPSVGSPGKTVSTDPETRVPFVAELLQSAFETIGISTFTEKRLSFDDHADIVPAQTPIRDSSSDAQHMSAGPGIKFVFRLFQNPTNEDVICPTYIDILENIVKRVINPQKSLSKSLLLLEQCLDTILPEKQEIPIQSWKVLAEAARNCLDAEASRTVLASPSSSMLNHKDQWWSPVMRLLDFGTRVQLNDGYREWQELTDSLCKLMRKQSDESFVNENVVEALSKILLDNNCLQLAYIGQLLDLANARAAATIKRVGPLDRKSKESISSEHEFEGLSIIVTEALLRIHKKWRFYKLSEGQNQFLSQVTAFIDRLPIRLIRRTIEFLQPGLCFFADREDEKVPTELFTSVVRSMTRLPNYNSSTLATFEGLLVAGFTSSNRPIQHETIEMWNMTYGTMADLVYSEELARTIQSQPVVLGALQLPKWPFDGQETQVDLPGTNTERTSGLSTSKERLDRNSRPPSRRSSMVDQTIEPSTVKIESTAAVSIPEPVSAAHSPRKTRKRKRQSSHTQDTTGSPNAQALEKVDDAFESEPVLPTADNLDHDDTPDTSQGRTLRSRGRKRIRTTSEDGPSIEAALKSSEQESDLIESENQELTLYKRKLKRQVSPQLQSDPISESSPTVMTRMRKLSCSTPSHPGDLVGSRIRSQSPSLRVSATPQEMPVFVDETVDVSDLLDSDSVMAMQIQDIMPTAVDIESHTQGESPGDGSDLLTVTMEVDARILKQEEREEEDDEDLFVAQLEQYRHSLKQGRPITPRRKKKIGNLIKEVTTLIGEVTSVYFEN